MIDFIELKIRLAEWILLKKARELDYMISKSNIDEIYKYRDRKKIVLTSIPSHGNLGDHAIAYASYKFFKDNFPGYEIIQLDMSQIYMYGKTLKSILNKDDYIATIGGGNMNNLYMHEEWTRRFVLKTFRNTPIISLPQTIAFTNDKKGKKELNKTKKIYGNNKNLTIFAREDKSFNIMKETFNYNRVLENPDMVFYLENLDIGRKFNRDGILICLRKDKEGYIGLESRNNIINNIKNDYKRVGISDTVIQKNVSVHTREEELNKIWSKFFASKVVVTDRLHGMIFAVITKTPCIVIRNSDHKIIESYKWIKDLNYIRLIDDFSYENINKNIEELINLKEVTPTNFKDNYFNKLVSKII